MEVCFPSSNSYHVGEIALKQKPDYNDDERLWKWNFIEKKSLKGWKEIK